MSKRDWEEYCEFMRRELSQDSRAAAQRCIREQFEAARRYYKKTGEL